MAISDTDRQVLRALTAAREQHKELVELLDFYHDLYQVQFEAKANMPEPKVRDELAMRWRLEGGIPQLTFDQLGIEPGPFARLIDQVADVLLRYNPTWEVEGKDRAAPELVALAQATFETWDTLATHKPDSTGKPDDDSGPDYPIALAVGFALAPHLQRTAEAILPHLDLSLWAQGYCPVCGGRPDLALFEQTKGARQLLCSRCNGLWNYQRIGCPFCRSEEKQTYHLSEDGVYRLYVCPTCNRYLKTVDLREIHRQVFPLVERLLTVGMDLAARQQGYDG